METTLFLSDSDGRYKMTELPVQAQYAPVYAINTSDFNGDGNKDILLFGNDDYFKLRLGKFDANYGTLLLGNGTGSFKYVNQIESGLDVGGNVKSSILIDDHLFLGIYGQPLETYEVLKQNIEEEL